MSDTFRAVILQELASELAELARHHAQHDEIHPADRARIAELCDEIEALR